MNDWSKPCLNGECFYDLPSSSGGSGFVKLSGQPGAIKDITPAAGWEVLDCKHDQEAQSIRLVCKGDAEGCNHLLNEPVGSIVRLPETCGKMAFARISAVEAAKDQAIPSSILPSVVRRDGSVAQVKMLHVDLDYEAVDQEKHGEISFVVAGINIPGIQGDFVIDHAALQARDQSDFVTKGLEQISN